jgi:hypothetical protein
MDNNYMEMKMKSTTEKTVTIEQTISRSVIVPQLHLNGRSQGPPDEFGKRRANQCIDVWA